MNKKFPISAHVNYPCNICSTSDFLVNGNFLIKKKKEKKKDKYIYIVSKVGRQLT